ncbi:MAG: FAD:protein FMN transferase [Denitrovibrio sp.]|nr:MAG: FAD:protein FMN transferase [Denitrovibrio sp.]
MSKLFSTAFYIILALSLVGCGEEKYQTERFYNMGTFVSLTLPKTKKNKKLTIDVRGRIQELENIIKKATDKANEDKQFCFEGIMNDLHETGIKYAELTDERFSIYAYTIAKEYGFHEGPYRVPSETRIKQLTKNINNLYDLQMDMGAYAKGYIVDKATDLLKEKNVKSAMLNAGGDLYALGKKGDRKWRVAIKHPDFHDKFLSIIDIENIALATSGDYERFFKTDEGERIFHIFDSTTGKNPQYHRSVSVIADTVEEADGLATSFFLMPIDEIAKKCLELKTPVLLYNKDDETTKLCGWEKFENN